MKAIFIALFFFSHLYSMSSETALEGLSLDESSAQAIKLKIIEGPDRGWHFLNSLVQAIIYPTAVTYCEDEIRFTHYEYSFIKYFESYRKAQEWLPMISESESDLEKAACDIVLNCKSYQSLEEVEKFRIARAWLHAFLTDSIDSPLIARRKPYLEGLKVGDHEKLALRAPQITRYTMSLINEIDRRKKELVS